MNENDAKGTQEDGSQLVVNIINKREGLETKTNNLTGRGEILTQQLSHDLYTCEGFSTTDDCIGSSPLAVITSVNSDVNSGFSTTDERIGSSPISVTTVQTTTSGSYLDCFHCDCVSSYTSVSGVYEITSPVTNNPILVECVIMDGYGYTVILQRHDGSVNFNRTYAEYRDGFGSPFTEMWLGNDYFNYLTSSWISRLYIELKYNDASFRYVDYFDVIIDSVYYQYHFDSMMGNASNILRDNEGYPFGTHDMDPYGCDCPMLKYGGWWHGCCPTPCGLTMPYNDPTYPFGWDCSTETTIKLTSVKMMTTRW